MKITLLRSDEIYKKMMNSPKEKRNDIYRYEMAKPFEFKWSCYNVPLKSSKKGSYDVVMASNMLAYLPPSELDETEEEGITYGIHLFNNVAMPLGIVRVSQSGDLKHASNVVPFDYTVYTSIMCAESLKFYWVTYQNQTVQCVDLNDLSKKNDYVQFELGRVTEFKYLTK